MSGIAVVLSTFWDWCQGSLQTLWKREEELSLLSASDVELWGGGVCGVCGPMSGFCPGVPTCVALISLQDSSLNKSPTVPAIPYMVRTHKLHKKLHVKFESTVTAVLQVPGRELISFQDSDVLGLWVLLRSTEAQRPKTVSRFLGAQLGHSWV